MKDFDLICKEFEQMDPVTFGELITVKSAQIVPALSAIAENGIEGTEIFFSFILGAIAADGKLSVEEFVLISPLLQEFFGQSIDYEECKALFRSMKRENKELKNLVDLMVDILGLVSEELKNDIITVCLMICAVDGKVSLKEKKWIKQLIA